MNLSTNRLLSAAGLCAAAAGALFIGVQINHPSETVEHVLNGDMTIRETAKAVMTVLALGGLAGMFARNRHRFGPLGVIGYVLVSIGYLAMFAVQCIVGFVLPTVARTSPAYVQDFIDGALGNKPEGDVGAMSTLFMVMGLGFAIGGLLFGIALFRAGILSRWASALFAYGTVSVLALSALPQSFNRPFAIPTGVALIGLGLSLYRDQRSTRTVDTTTPVQFAATAAR